MVGVPMQMRKPVCTVRVLGVSIWMRMRMRITLISGSQLPVEWFIY